MDFPSPRSSPERSVESPEYMDIQGFEGFSKKQKKDEQLNLKTFFSVRTMLIKSIMNWMSPKMISMLSWLKIARMKS